MRARFDGAYIEAELERLGTQINTPVTVYLIGGGAMAFRDLKNTTKDIDLVVTNGEDLKRLQAVLLANGYEIVKQPGDEYEVLGAHRILENSEGCRVDVFNRQVVDKLVLSEGMRRRSERYLDAGRLAVELVSPEDIFLFKSVAGRTDDIEDMFSLIQTALDFDVIADELQRQIDLLEQELFISYINEALLELEAEYNVTTPIAEPVSEITHRVYREIDVLQAVEESIARTELETRIDLPDGEMREVLERLETKGVITVEDGRIRKKSSTL